MTRQKIHIKGMHCRSCEIVIEDELKKVHGVQSVSVNHQTGIAHIVCNCALDNQAITKAVECAGYSIGNNGKVHIFSYNREDYVDLGIAFFITMALFLVANKLGIFNLSSSISGTYSSLPIVFLIGLTAGVSTCMALVGGLVLGASARFSAQNPHASGMEKFTPHLYFNLGRIISFFIFGGVIGFAGSLFQLSTTVLGILTVAVGMVMLLLGGQLIDVFPILKKISFTLPKSLSRMLGISGKSLERYSNKNSAVMGAMTFFLPCGFTQAMQLFAMSTGNLLTGAMTMGIFALGTAPGLLGVGGLTSIVTGAITRLFFKTAGVIVIILAFFNVSNGLNLLGIPQILGTFAINDSIDREIKDPNVKLVNGVQEVRMIQDSSGYSPNKFTIKNGVPVKWIVTSKDVYTCASSIVSQQLGIRKGLELGENVFEFTPTQSGTIRFSCSMGMYTGSFTVIDENSNSGIPEKITTQGDIQILKATYTSLGDISSNKFAVKVNQAARFEIMAKDDGYGCMSSITIPNLTKKVEAFTKGQTTYL